MKTSRGLSMATVAILAAAVVTACFIVAGLVLLPGCAQYSAGVRADRQPPASERESAPAWSATETPAAGRGPSSQPADRRVGGAPPVHSPAEPAKPAPVAEK